VPLGRRSFTYWRADASLLSRSLEVLPRSGLVQCPLSDLAENHAYSTYDQKLSEWEHFYNYNRPHGAHHGKTPYEALREKLR
jgi:hypothetical protein